MSFDTLDSVGQLPDESSNYGPLQSFSLSFCWVKFFLSLCYHFTFTLTVAITGAHQIEYFSLHSCLLLTFWIYVPLLHVWELVEDSGDLCQPQNLTYEETCGSLNFKTVAHLNYSLYFILNLTGALFPKLSLKFAISFQQRFHILLVTCSVIVAWGVTRLLRLHCCVACGTFSSFNCGKNVYYYCSLPDHDRTFHSRKYDWTLL